MAQGKLNSQDYNIRLKKGVEANINATATKNLALEAEPHYTTDTDQLYVFDGALNRPTSGQIPVLVKSADHTLTNADYAIDVTASSDVTITLPAGSSNKCFIISKADSGSGKIIVDGDASETINGSTTVNLLSQYDSIFIYWNSSEWRIS